MKIRYVILQESLFIYNFLKIFLVKVPKNYESKNKGIEEATKFKYKWLAYFVCWTLNKCEDDFLITYKVRKIYI